MIRHLTPTVFCCHELVENLRAPDRAEVLAARGGLTALELWASVQQCTESFAVYSDDGLVCMYGVAAHPIQSEVGIVWLLGTPLLDRHMFSLCRQAKEQIAEWHTRFSVLTNMTDHRNRRILRWVRWLGFRLVDEVRIGPESIPFIIFQSRNDGKASKSRNAVAARSS